MISVEMLRSSLKRNLRDAAALVITSQTRTPCSDKWLLNALPNLAVARSITGGPKTREIGDMMARPASPHPNGPRQTHHPSHPNPDDKRSTRPATYAFANTRRQHEI